MTDRSPADAVQHHAALMLKAANDTTERLLADRQMLKAERDAALAQLAVEQALNGDLRKQNEVEATQLDAALARAEKAGG